MKAVFSYVQALVMVMVAVFLLSFTTAKPLSNEDSEKGITELHFAGKLENLPVFRLAIKNSNLSEYNITVRQGNGDVIFSETLKGENISRMYKLDTESMELISNTTFEITNKKNNSSNVYRISNLTEITESMVVTKL